MNVRFEVAHMTRRRLTYRQTTIEDIARLRRVIEERASEIAFFAGVEPSESDRKDMVGFICRHISGGDHGDAIRWIKRDLLSEAA